MNVSINLMEIKGLPLKIVLIKAGNFCRKYLLDFFISIKPMIEDLDDNNYGLLEIV
jgi:hypothetical protein